MVACELKPAHCFNKGLNEKFTPRDKMTIIGLFRYFWVYITHQKPYHPILNLPHTIEAFPSKIISLQTTIVGEAQELLVSGFSMGESSSFSGFKQKKGMVILHL